jgi:integrase
MGVHLKQIGKSWYAFINHKGIRKCKRIGRDKGTAQEVAKKLEARLALGEFKMEGVKPIFKEYAEGWLRKEIEPVKRASTTRRYSDLLTKYIYPAIGSIPLDRITRADVKQFLLTKHGEGFSKSSLALMKDVISGPLNSAIDAEIIETNPTRGIIKGLGIKREKKESLDPLNKGEVELFLHACLKHFGEYYPFFLCAFRTGLRLGELLGLRWGDVDWNGKYIKVERSYKLKTFSPTKTDKARHVDLARDLIEMLKGHYMACKEKGLQMGQGGAPEAIFHREGQTMEQNFIRRVFKRVLGKAGLREIRIHDIRHSYASILLSEGVPVIYVKEQLGHSSIQMTVDIYGHYLKDTGEWWLDRLLPGAQKNANQAQMEK